MSALLRRSISPVTPNDALNQVEITSIPEPIFNRGVSLFIKHAKLFFVISLLGAAAAIGISYLKTPVFKAEAVLIPSDEMLGLEQNSGLGGLGGLATLVGAGSAGNKQDEAVAVLKSRALVYTYVQANTLLPILFSKSWNSAEHRWSSSEQSQGPSLEDAYILFDGIRTVVENRKTGLITLSVTWKDPKLAKQWVDGLVSTTNDILRQQAIERSTKNLEYLQSASVKTPIMEVKNSIYKLMENEIKKQMTAVGSFDYAFRVVDPAVIPEHKSAPKRSIYAVFGAVLGAMLWLLIVAFRSQMNSVERVA